MEVQLNGEMLDEVENFRHLEMTIAANMAVKTNMINKMNGRCKFLVGMKKIMRNRRTGMKEKDLYERILVLTVMYRSHLW